LGPNAWQIIELTKQGAQVGHHTQVASLVLLSCKEQQMEETKSEDTPSSHTSNMFVFCNDSANVNKDTDRPEGWDESTQPNWKNKTWWAKTKKT
jgi:hypothetical protein